MRQAVARLSEASPVAPVILLCLRRQLYGHATIKMGNGMNSVITSLPINCIIALLLSYKESITAQMSAKMRSMLPSPSIWW